MHSVSLNRSEWGGMAPLLTPGTLVVAGSKFQNVQLVWIAWQMHSVSLNRSEWGGMAPLLLPGTLFGAGSKFQSISLEIFQVWRGADCRRSNWVG